MRPTRADVGMCPATMLPDPFAFSMERLEALVQACVHTGFRSWSPWALSLNAVGLAGAKDRIVGAGITVPVVEALSQWSGGASTIQVGEVSALLDVAQQLGASTVAACTLEPAIDLDLAAEGFARSCEAAAAVGVRVCLEFLPWTGIPDLATAWELVQRAGAPNGGLLLDTWHWNRQPGGPAPELLRTIPGERIHYIQLCDAARDSGLEPMAECMSARLPPGAGLVDFDQFWDAVEATGAEPIVMAEVFNTDLASRGPQAYAEAIWNGLGTILPG
jgi:sugar phosphate isomerase/epimerase